MLKRSSCFFAYLLMALIPLQGVAAANLSICNSLMQPDAQQAMHNMPCHDGMSSNSQQHEEASKHEKPSNKDTCKTRCAALCAMTALPCITHTATFLSSTQAIINPQQVYVSITQPNLQRPPISFI